MDFLRSLSLWCLSLRLAYSNSKILKLVEETIFIRFPTLVDAEFSLGEGHTHVSLKNTLTGIFDFAAISESLSSTTTAIRDRIGAFSPGSFASTALGSYSAVDAFDFGTSATGTSN